MHQQSKRQIRALDCRLRTNEPRVSASGTLILLANLLRAAESLLVREEFCKRRELLLIHARNDAGHDRILALTALVVAQRLLEIIGVLAREDRVVRSGRRGAIRAMTRHASLGRRRRRADNFLIG